MDWIKNFNRAIDYVEMNITEELDYELVANEAYSSKFHFLRVFSILTGKTLGEYIKDRRLTLAANQIVSTECKVIDVAMKYCYEDHGAFSKAFKRFHGVTPTQAKNSNMILHAAPPLKFFIDVKGEEKVDYKIVKKKSFKVVGVSTEVTTKDGENYKIIPKFWKDKNSDGTINEILPHVTELGLVGICYNFNMDTEKFRYMIAVEGDSPKDNLKEILAVGEYIWAIFPGMGTMPDSIQTLWKKIFQEWFPATNYVHAKGPELEVYLGKDYTSQEEKYEIWIPVELKK